MNGEEGKKNMDREEGKGYHPIVFYLLVIAGAFVLGIVIFNYIVLPLLVGRGDVAIVPEINGMRVSPAEEVCRSSGLRLMVTGERYSEEYPAGIVIDQDPGSGESLKGNRTVRVIISSGERMEEVPPMAGESMRQAELLLDAARLGKGRIARVFSPGSGPNLVLASSPAAGSRAATGSKIDILLSMTGEPKVFLMPDLRGMDLPFVKGKLEENGFEVARVVSRKESGFFPNTILSQTPAPGCMIMEGGAIELVVSTVD